MEERTSFHLFDRLSLDVWNKHLCQLLDHRDYDALWTIGDRRLRVLLQSLRLDYLAITREASPRSDLVKLLCLRCTRRIEIQDNTDDTFTTFASAATIVESASKDIGESISFSHWPNLQSLSLVNTRFGALQSNLSLMTLIDALPSSLTELFTQDAYNSDVTQTTALDPFIVSRALSQKLPHLVSLDICNYTLLLPSKGDDECQWPLGLTSLSLMLAPTRPDDVLHLGLPSTLTDLRLPETLTTYMPASIEMHASSLPPSLLTLEVLGIRLRYDAPLPPHLMKLDCYDVTPSFNEVSFELPPTITFLAPEPDRPCSPKFRANIRVSSLLTDYQAVPVLGAEDEQVWIEMERRFAAEEAQRNKECNEVGFLASDATVMTHVDFEKVAHVFTRPASWSYWNRFKKFGVLDTLLPIITKTVSTVLNVSCPDLVTSLLTQAKWLTAMDLTSAAATETFLQFVIDASSSMIHPRMPHLLQKLKLHLVDGQMDMIGHLDMIVRRHTHLQLSNIRELTLSMSIYHLTHHSLHKTIPKLFPRVTSLAVLYHGFSPERMPFYPAREFRPLLDGLKCVTTLFIAPVDCDVMRGFEQSERDFLAEIPDRITDLNITSGSARLVRRDGVSFMKHEMSAGTTCKWQ